MQISSLRGAKLHTLFVTDLPVSITDKSDCINPTKNPYVLAKSYKRRNLPNCKKNDKNVTFTCYFHFITVSLQSQM